MRKKGENEREKREKARKREEKRGKERKREKKREKEAGWVFEKEFFFQEEINNKSIFAGNTFLKKLFAKRRMFIKSPECVAIQVPAPVFSIPLPVFTIR